jgi:hypothetical protein
MSRVHTIHDPHPRSTSTFKDGKPAKRTRNQTTSSESTTPQTHDEDEEGEDESEGGTVGEDIGSDEDQDGILPRLHNPTGIPVSPQYPCSRTS